jgi:two-component system LytT family response regulator
VENGSKNNISAPQPPIRALIVDDEPHARRYLCELLDGESEVLVIGEGSSGAEGIEQIRALSPDVVFLDIQMPDLDGFAMVERLDSAKVPLFIFVTGYSEYAVKAFEIEAVDYLCKPFDKERLLISLERAIRRIGSREVVVSGNEGERWLTRLSIKDENGIVFVPVEQILWIEAANKYVVIYTAAGSHIARQTIQSFEDSLDPRKFVRIHRSIVVQKAAVRGLHPLFHGDYLVNLVNGAELTLSRSFRESFFYQMSR